MNKITLSLWCLVLIVSVSGCALHGECHSFESHSGYKYYRSTQYLFGKVIYQNSWSDPIDAPNPPDEGGIIGPAQYWWGFGILRKKTVHYE